jgi:hypothetical protein
LVFDTLIVLSNYRSPVILEEPPVVRALKLEGTHLKPELAAARFLSELLRPRTIRSGGKVLEQETWAEIGQNSSTSREGTGEGAGKKYQAHWIRGHLRRVRFGKGLCQSRLSWIAPYPKGEFRHEQQKMS